MYGENTNTIAIPIYRVLLYPVIYVVGVLYTCISMYLQREFGDDVQIRPQKLRLALRQGILNTIYMYMVSSKL